jgi:hypothetical protein
MDPIPVLVVFVVEKLALRKVIFQILYFGFPYKFHCTNVLYLYFNHVQSELFNLSIWQRR